LPTRAWKEISKYFVDENSPSEITLRADRPTSISFGYKNIRTSVILTRDELSRTLGAFCSNSFHAHEQSMKNGFVTWNGCRIGIGGVYSQTSIPSTVTSLCIRIKRNVKGCAKEIVEQLAANDFRDGLIIFSPPGYGKTTALRDFAATVSSPPYMKRVAIVDSRGELDDGELYRGGLVDVVGIANKGRGIEMAVRTLDPEIVVCDEIGADEADAILRTQSGGVPLVASAHATDLDELLSCDSIAKLIYSGIFCRYCAIKRKDGQRFLEIGHIKSREERG
jgi:stage III sporulation protein AA